MDIQTISIIHIHHYYLRVMLGVDVNLLDWLPLDHKPHVIRSRFALTRPYHLYISTFEPKI